jgi:TPR repeat protein
MPKGDKQDEEFEKNYMKRVKVNDPVALYQMGGRYHDKGDCGAAFEYSKKAAELGYVAAHFNLAFMYHEGKGVEKDIKNAVYHWEEAAIGGHPDARYNLGNQEGRKGRFDRAAKHYIIAAKLGDDCALEAVKEGFVKGFVSKEGYEVALRGHQAAVDATKSEQRDAAYAFFNRRAS